MSRRSVLLGAAGLAGTTVLAACGSSGPAATSTGTNVALTPNSGGSSLIPMFGTDAQYQYIVTGSPQRLAFGLNDADGQSLLDVPASLAFQLSREGTPLGAATTVTSHADGVPVGYFPYRTTFDAPGTYQLEVVVDGQPSTVSFDVIEPSSTMVLPRGATMIPADTPTAADHRGVEPICTQPSGTCPFHTQTLAAALATGQPIALMVSTPKFCQIGVCGPVLDLLIELTPQYPGVQVVHAEVYTDAEAQFEATSATSAPSGVPAAPAEVAGSATLAPIVETYGLTFEPALFLADRGGVVIDRLDNIFDRGEITEGLKAIA